MTDTMPDTADSDNWLSRTELLLGRESLAKIVSANVAVVGLGGVGGHAAEMICRAGVGKMTIVDGDTVEDSNRNRQLAALKSTAGRLKAEVMAERLRDIAPALGLDTVADFIGDGEMDAFVKNGNFDCVIDAIDSLAPKIALITACLKYNVPVVSSMGSGARLDPEKIHTVRLAKTSGCPLARAVRAGLRKNGYDDPDCLAVFSAEPPVRSAIIDPGKCENNKRAVLGTISFIPALFGCHCAAAAIKLLARQE